MEMSGQLHSGSLQPAGKCARYTLKQKAVWAPTPVLTFWRTGNRSSYRPTSP